MGKRAMEQAVDQLAMANKNLAQAKSYLTLAYVALYASLIFLSFVLGRLTS